MKYCGIYSISATSNRFFLLYSALFFLTLYSFRLFYSNRTIPETKNMHRHTAHIGTGNFNRDILYSASGLTRADYAPIVDVVHPCKQQTYKSPRSNKNLAMARSICVTYTLLSQWNRSAAMRH